VAVPVADAGLREALAATRASLSGSRDLRWVRDEQLHLTLRFFADLPGGNLQAVEEASRAACSPFSPFALEVRGLGRFPAHGPLRVVWAGLGAGREALVALAASLAGELEARGFPAVAGEKPFAPHLTLARARDPRGSRDAARAVAALTPSTGAFGAQRVEALVLFRSDLGSGPPVHTPLGRYPLARPLRPEAAPR
jgi:2'-5' RNA ligase